MPYAEERPYHVVVAAAALGLALAEARVELLVVVSALCFAVLARMGAARLGAIAAAVVLAGALAGELRLAAIDAPAARLRDGESVDLRAHLRTAPRPGLFGASAEIEVAGGRLNRARLLLRIPRWSPLPGSARPGSELRLKGRTKALGPGAFAGHLRRRGIAGELLLDRARVTGERRGGAPGLLDRMRARAERAVVAGMAPDEAALLRGMVLGQDERISESVREDFRASGLAHLLAVSGQNVMLLAALALPLLMFAGLGVRGRLAVLAVLIALYVPLAGAGPSLQRAGVMGLAGIAAMAASRPSSRSYALLLAAAATLAWNPRAWADPGWQLSFAAVVGILALANPPREGAATGGGGARARDAGGAAMERACAGRRGGHHGRGHRGHGAAAGPPLRLGSARRPAGQRAGPARGGAGHVARNAQDGGRAGRRPGWRSPPRSASWPRCRSA